MRGWEETAPPSAIRFCWVKKESFGMKHQRAYRYRFYPTPAQARQLAHTFGCVRFVYNFGLRLRTDAYREQGEHLFYSHTSAALTTLKQQPKTAWLNEVSSVPPQQALRHLDTAFARFFKRQAKYPTFKKKHGPQAAEYTRSAFRWDGTHLLLAKLDEPLHIVWSRPLPEGCLPSTVTVCRDAAGRYFVSFRVEEDIAPLPARTEQVGVDLGLTSLAALSTGEKLPNPKHLAKREKQLERWQRKESRRTKGGKNRVKARRKVNKIHGRIADARKDGLHQLTTRLIRENQTICIESLAVKQMVQHPTLAKAISDAGWGKLARQLDYKARWYGRTLIKIDRWFPSSKTCSVCGHVLDSLALDVRWWTCPRCGTAHDRDVNAARSILAEGLSLPAAGLAVAACGGTVSPNLNGNQGRQAPGKQEPE
ncbi:MAG TPA: RNA-guided endonuclease TnpB family protein [Ktedonobacteraceae bacterium]|nr:RNA-guided endonuclease TnpB family protein [Ktedonobacteraceae bacterium]